MPEMLQHYLFRLGWLAAAILSAENINESIVAKWRNGESYILSKKKILRIEMTL
jgi:hypothetical protein